MMRSLCKPAGRAGFTLIEMVGVLVIVLSIGAWGLATTTRPSAAGESRSTALRMRTMLVSALATADLEGGDVVVRAVADTMNGPGRFLAVAGPVGVAPEDDPGADWVLLERGVRWRKGSATVDPMGASTDGRVPGTVRCSGRSCETGSTEYVVYYIGHARSDRVAWGLVLTRDRDVMLFTWNSASEEWQPGEPG